MLAKVQEKIIDLFRKDIFLSESIRKISVLLKKTYPGIYKAVKELESEGIMKIKKFGNSNICSLNLNKEAISFLSLLDKQEAFSKNIPNIDTILEFKEFLDDIIVIAGSYASGKQQKNSDVDLAIITKDNAYKKQKLMENRTFTMSPQIHVVAFNFKDFIDMLLNDEFNFGKEVFKNRLIFRNSERYYELIKEAVKNGFKG